MTDEIIEKHIKYQTNAINFLIEVCLRNLMYDYDKAARLLEMSKELNKEQHD